MAPTPYFLFGAAPEDTPAAGDTSAHAVAPDLSDAVARARLRPQAASGPGRQQVASRGGGGAPPRKTPQRGLGVAELERLRCGGVDPLHELNAAAAAAMLEAAAANLQAQQGNSVVLQQHHDYLPAFDAATGSRYYSPLLVQPPPAPPAPQPPTPVQGVAVAPDQQYFMDHWGRMGGFVPAGNGHQPQLQVPAPEYPLTQSTIWRPACSSASCLHAGQRCYLCSKTMVALTDRGTRGAAAAAAAAAAGSDYSIYDLAAVMTAARKETAGEGFLVAPEGRKEVREIEFFPTRVTSNGGGPDESELRRTPPSSSSSPPGGVGGSLDLSLRL